MNTSPTLNTPAAAPTATDWYFVTDVFADALGLLDEDVTREERMYLKCKFDFNGDDKLQWSGEAEICIQELQKVLESRNTYVSPYFPSNMYEDLEDLFHFKYTISERAQAEYESPEIFFERVFIAYCLSDFQQMQEHYTPASMIDGALNCIKT